MNLFNNLISKAGIDTTVHLAADQMALKKSAKNIVDLLAPRSISRTRKDIKDWNDAINMASNVEQPKRFALYNLYDNILVDLHLQSQINNRLLKSLSQSFVIKDLSGNLNQELIDLLQNKRWVYQINKAILETVFYGHTLGEFSYVNNELVYTIIPRTNVDPSKGYVYFDYADDKKIDYRTQKEYGSWLIEFGNPKDFGLLNGCVPHVLFKRFSMSCYSELCEIYGIPPRVLKTNTQDKTMVSRGEKMLKDMGAAAWFIIDENESFDFAQGVNTNGDVYTNLITLCNNEMSMGISGTVVGQDTKNGSNSKEKTSIGILSDLVQSDLTLIETAWNSTVIPALKALGIITSDIVFAYPPAKDLEMLWKMTTEAANFLEIDPVWVKDTFGIEVVGKKQAAATTKLSIEDYERFFV
jgi:Protein of unknown function (DUF935)